MHASLRRSVGALLSDPRLGVDRIAKGGPRRSVCARGRGQVKVARAVARAGGFGASTCDGRTCWVGGGRKKRSSVSWRVCRGGSRRASRRSAVKAVPFRYGSLSWHPKSFAADTNSLRKTFTPMELPSKPYASPHVTGHTHWWYATPCNGRFLELLIGALVILASARVVWRE